MKRLTYCARVIGGHAVAFSGYLYFTGADFAHSAAGWFMGAFIILTWVASENHS